MKRMALVLSLVSFVFAVASPASAKLRPLRQRSVVSGTYDSGTGVLTLVGNSCPRAPGKADSCHTFDIDMKGRPIDKGKFKGEWAVRDNSYRNGRGQKCFPALGRGRFQRGDNLIRVVMDGSMCFKADNPDVFGFSSTFDIRGGEGRFKRARGGGRVSMIGKYEDLGGGPIRWKDLQADGIIAFESEASD